MLRSVSILFFLLITFLQADPTIEVVKKVSTTVNVSVASNVKSPALNSLNEELLYMIKADLKVAGIYRVKESGNVDYKISYTLEKDPNGYRVEFYVKNLTGKTILNKIYKFSKSDRYPFLAHRFVVDLSYKFGIYSLEWMEKLVLSSTLVAPGETEIMISDYSLTYQKRILNGGINMFPKWADKRQEKFFYTKYEDELVLYSYNIVTGEKRKIISGSGMLACSDVSSNGKRLLLTMGDSGQPDIYEYNLVTGSKKRLTTYGGIDVNGNYIDDEKSFVFVSDRFGYPEIFKGNIKNKMVEQMVFKGKNNNYVDTHKDKAIFVSRDTDSEFGRNTFNVYLISTQTDYIRQLTSTGQNYFPKFSDDGNTIIYIKNYKNESALGVIRLNQNKSFLFPLKSGKIKSVDW